MKKVFAFIKFAVKALYKALALSVRRLPAMSGGYPALILSLLLAFLMFFTAHHALGTKTASALRFACVDDAGTAVSKELIASIRRVNGASAEILECDSVEAARRLIENGEAEGILHIGAGFDESLKAGKAALEYFPAPGAFSAQAARELIAGEAVTLGSRLRAENYFFELTGRAPNEQEKRDIVKAYSERLAFEGSAVEKQTVYSGASAGEESRETNLFSAFFARYSGFSAFVIMLILLMLGAFSASRDEKNCAERMASLAFGRTLSFLSWFFSMMLVGLLLLGISFIPEGGADAAQICAGVAYVFCAASLALLIGGLSGSARAELASPLVAFLTALAGGCFTDHAALGEGFKTLARFTPQGQYLATLGGETLFIPALFAEGLILLLLSRLLRGVERAVQAR